MSVGVGLDSIALNVQPVLRLIASVILVLGGISCPVPAWFGWVHVEYERVLASDVRYRFVIDISTLA